MIDLPQPLTLREAQDIVERGREEGIACPCCRQLAKTYKRKLGSGMAHALLIFYRDWWMVTKEWIDLTNTLLRHNVSAANSNAALLRHWKLIEAMPGTREDGSSRVGLYRMTDLGVRFARGVERVPRYAYLYNQELLGLDLEESTDIREALAAKFNYTELMSGL